MSLTNKIQNAIINIKISYYSRKLDRAPLETRQNFHRIYLHKLVEKLTDKDNPLSELDKYIALKHGLNCIEAIECMETPEAKRKEYTNEIKEAISNWDINTATEAILKFKPFMYVTDIKPVEVGSLGQIYKAMINLKRESKNS